MRTISTAQGQILGLRTRSTHFRARVDGGSGFVDLSDLEGRDWLASVEYGESVDSPVQEAKIRIHRKVYDLNMSPLYATSKLNDPDVLLAIGNPIVVETAVLAEDVEPTDSDWVEVFRGEVDDINWPKDPIMVRCRDNGRALVDRFIETQQKYPPDPATTIKLEDLIQDILDRTNPSIVTVTQSLVWNGTTTITTTDTSGLVVGQFLAFSDAATASDIPYFEISVIVPNTSITILNPSSRTIPTGSGVSTSRRIDAADRITLYSVTGDATTPFKAADSPGFVITEYIQKKQSVMEALRALSDQIGYRIRYQWQDNVSSFELMLTQPDRTQTVADYTFEPDRYYSIDQLAISRKNIRNVVRVVYEDATAGRSSVTQTDSSSVTKYGRRFMEIQEAGSSQIDTATEANTFASACLDDLSEPDADHAVVLPYFWPAETPDLYQFDANGVHYNTSQKFALVSVRHTLTKKQARTNVVTRGRPSSGLRRWLRFDTRDGVSTPNDTRTNQAPENGLFESNIGVVIVTYDDPRGMTPPITDWLYTECHIAQVSGFTPDPSTLKAKGRTTRFEIGGLVPGTTYYCKLGIVDASENPTTYIQVGPIVAQEVAAFHQNTDSLPQNLILNWDFGQTTFDVTTTPPDNWEMVSGAWGTAGDAYFDAITQETGFRSLDLLATKTPTVGTSKFIPVAENRLYRVGAAFYVSSVAGGDEPLITIQEFDRSKGALGSFTTTIPITAINTWEGVFFYAYLGGVDGSTGTRFVKLELLKNSASVNVLVDRVYIAEERHSFSAYRLNATSVSSGSPQKVSTDTELFDNKQVVSGGKTYGHNLGRFRALVPGQYTFQFGGGLSGVSLGTTVEAGFLLNGVADKKGQSVAAQGGTTHANVAATYEMVRDDYVEPYLFHNEGVGLSLVTGANNTYFTGSRIDDR